MVGIGSLLARYAIVLSILVAGSWWSASGACARETITFDDVALAGNPPRTNLDIGPWRFSSQPFHSVSLPAAGVLALVDNATPYIASVGGGLDFPITLERADRAPFALFGFDGGELFLSDLDAITEGFLVGQKIQVIGEQTGGDFVLAEFALDGVKDGPGDTNDFQSFALASEFEHVVSVTFTGLTSNRHDAAFALDNIVVGAAVPEPATVVLAVSALVAVSATRCRRRASHR